MSIINETTPVIEAPNVGYIVARHYSAEAEMWGPWRMIDTCKLGKLGWDRLDTHKRRLSNGLYDVALVDWATMDAMVPKRGAA